MYQQREREEERENRELVRRKMNGRRRGSDEVAIAVYML